MKQFVSHYLMDHITKEDTVIDATVGHGNDTLFLAEIAKFVYGFDIQQAAIDSTKAYLKSFKKRNVKLFLDSHEHILDHVTDFKGVVFNLGYLPRSDKSITTTKDTTLYALHRLTTHMNDETFIVITCYPGHEAGFVESEAVKTYSASLDENFDVLTYQFSNKPNAPFVVVIEKKRSQA